LSGEAAGIWMGAGGAHVRGVRAAARLWAGRCVGPAGGAALWLVRGGPAGRRRTGLPSVCGAVREAGRPCQGRRPLPPSLPLGRGRARNGVGRGNKYFAARRTVGPGPPVSESAMRGPPCGQRCDAPPLWSAGRSGVPALAAVGRDPNPAARATSGSIVHAAGVRKARAKRETARSTLAA
jgi:hypothetical protein